MQDSMSLGNDRYLRIPAEDQAALNGRAGSRLARRCWPNRSLPVVPIVFDLWKPSVRPTEETVTLPAIMAR
jgi:hypothetical protein